jgi:protein gp37
MDIVFNKISSPNKILSVWDVLVNGDLSVYQIVGEQHPRFKNVYSIYNKQQKKMTMIGSLEKAKQVVRNQIIKNIKSEVNYV